MNAAEFNARYPVGTPVVAYPFIRPEHPAAVRYREAVEAGRAARSEKDPCTRLVTATRTPAWKLGHGEAVVSVDGYAGGIVLDHVDIAPRTNTPDRVVVGEDGRKSTTIKLKRACNGCDQYLGDADNRDVDEHGNLTDVRHECANCRPLVELEAAGCEVRQLTPRTIGELWHWIDNGKPFYISDPANTKWGLDGCPPGLKVDGLSVFSPRQDTDEIRHDRHVARFGDWIIRHPDGQWSVHKAPAESVTEAAS